MEREVIPHTFYFYVHYKLKNFSRGKPLSTRKCYEYFFHWGIPKAMRSIFLKELEILDLVEKVNREKVIIKESDFTLDQVNHIKESLGIIPSGS
jgi:hypothetical protein